MCPGALWFLCAPKLPAACDTAVSHYEKNSDLYLFLIIVFAQPNTSLIALYVKMALVHDQQNKWCFRARSRLSLPVFIPGEASLGGGLAFITRPNTLSPGACASQWILTAWFAFLTSFYHVPVA